MATMTSRCHKNTNNNRRLTKQYFTILPIAVLLLSLLIFASNTGSNSVEAYCPVVICPGFGNDSIDYDTPLKQPSDVGLKSVLTRRGFDSSQIYTVPVKRSDWIKVAGGLFDVPDFYLGTAKPTGFGYGWYVRRLKETIDIAYEESGGEKVLLIGHSAGGWLARAAMGDGRWSENVNDDEKKEVVRTSDRVRCLATIGSIHMVPEQESTCVTRGALKYTDDNYPGAFLMNEGIGYVSVGGEAIIGDDTKEDKDIQKKINNEDGELLISEVDALYKKRGEGNANRVAFSSYKAVSGNGNLIGDGVVPIPWTQLEGSKQVVLKNVLHSINEAGTTKPTDRWYGSENVVDRWLPAVLEEANINKKKRGEIAAFDLDGLQQWASNLVRR
jgi:pimeloyl-ACP methyl ester carboxylesterase